MTRFELVVADHLCSDRVLEPTGREIRKPWWSHHSEMLHLSPCRGNGEPRRRRYVAARQWTSVEYIDRGVSGAKDRRPALDELLRDARRRRFDVLVCGRLDRLGRNLKHLVTMLDELQALGIPFVSLAEGIDATTPAGKLQMHILGAIAEFERARIVERVRAGLARRVAQGKSLGRPRQTIRDGDLARTSGLSTRKAAGLSS